MNKKILIISIVLLTLNITFAEGCSSLGINFESLLTFFASVPEFVMNLILCIQPIFLLIFALGIAGVLLLIFRSVLK